jgi:RNA polymerase sigma factor (TIGR02999 family)
MPAVARRRARGDGFMSQAITRLLVAIRQGDRGSIDELFSLVYDELKRIAHWQLERAGPRRPIDTTALVHEAYLKFAAVEEPGWEHRRHFYRVAARAMRQIIVDQARRHRAQKREGRLERVDLDVTEVQIEDHAEELLAIDEALAKLDAQDPRLAQVIELRFFAGLSVEDTARALDVSDRTVKRDWRLARAFLHKELGSSS